MENSLFPSTTIQVLQTGCQGWVINMQGDRIHSFKNRFLLMWHSKHCGVQDSKLPIISPSLYTFLFVSGRLLLSFHPLFLILLCPSVRLKHLSSLKQWLIPPITAVVKAQGFLSVIKTLKQTLPRMHNFHTCYKQTHTFNRTK